MASENKILYLIFIDKDGYIITGAEGAINKETLLLGIDYIK